MRPTNMAASAILTLLLAALLPAAGHAQEAERYRLEKTAEGYVRMDTQTGAMSLCEERSGQLVCRVAADERTALQDEIEGLQNSIRSLDQRVAKLEGSLAAKLESSLPSEEEFDRTLGYMERFLRSFMGIVKDLNRQDDSGGTTPAPDRT